MEKITKEEKDYIVECQKKMTSFFKACLQRSSKKKIDVSKSI